MRIDWGMLLTIFLAVVLAKIFTQGLLSGGNNEGTLVGAVVNSPAVPTVTYANPIDEYLAKNHPGAQR